MTFRTTELFHSSNRDVTLYRKEKKKKKKISDEVKKEARLGCKNVGEMQVPEEKEKQIGPRRGGCGKVCGTRESTIVKATLRMTMRRQIGSRI